MRRVSIPGIFAALTIAAVARPGLAGTGRSTAASASRWRTSA